MLRPISGSPRLRRAVWFAAWFAAAFALRVGALTREGISADEEITIFAVRGIAVHGLPVLPSGLVYERGLLFSYAAWVARLVSRSEVVSARTVSLLAGCALVPLLALLARRLGGSATLVAIASCAASGLMASSTWGRFYALFVLGVACTTLLWLAPERSHRAARWSVAALAATCLLHETGVVLVALPLFSYLQSPPASTERRHAAWSLLVWCAVIVMVEVFLAWLHGDLGRLSPAQFLAPPVASGRWPFMPISLHTASTRALVTMAAGASTIGILLYGIRAPFVFCVAGAVCAATLNVGALWMIALGLVLARPEQQRRLFGATALASALALGLWISFLLATTAAAASFELFTVVTRAAFVLPFAALTYLVRHWPLLLLSGAIGAWLGRHRNDVRAVTFLALAAIVFLGSLPLGPKPRYLLPVFALLLVLASIVPEVVGRVLAAPRAQRTTGIAAASALLVLLLIEDRRAARTDALLTTTHGLAHLRTVSYRGLTDALRARPSASPLLCNDDLLCLLADQHADDLWLGSEPEADAMGVKDKYGWRSLYTDAPIVVGRAGLLTTLSGRREATVVLFDGPKYHAAELEEMLPHGEWQLEPQRPAEDVRIFRLRAPAPRPDPLPVP